jgi:hypothetical protein
MLQVWKRSNADCAAVDTERSISDRQKWNILKNLEKIEPKRHEHILTAEIFLIIIILFLTVPSN